jgi:F-type H+-transporting ATPase subunit gamma
VKPTADPEAPLLVAVSSDRGLCGAIHSSIAKSIRKTVRESHLKASIVVLGDKAKPQVAREARNNISLHFNQLGRNIPLFADAANVVDILMKQEAIPLSSVQIYHNRFKSVIAYENTVLAGFSEAKLKTAGTTQGGCVLEMFIFL